MGLDLFFPSQMQENLKVRDTCGISLRLCACAAALTRVKVHTHMRVPAHTGPGVCVSVWVCTWSFAHAGEGVSASPCVHPRAVVLRASVCTSGLAGIGVPAHTRIFTRRAHSPSSFGR